MIFDKGCAVVERHFPHLRDWFDVAALFHVDIDASKTLRKDYEGDEAAQRAMLEDFHLPFSLVAIEDRTSTVLLRDRQPLQLGAGGLRDFICVSSLADADPSTFADASEEQMREMIARAEQQMPGAVVLVGGAISITGYQDRNWRIAGEVNWSAIASKETLYAPIGPDAPPFEQMGKEALAAMEEVLYLNQPSRFVFEISPLKQRRGPKIQRAHERSLFTLLTPEEIRKRYLPEEPSSHASPVPHLRRRHFRTLNSEKYTHARGKRILVAATWVGPEEKIVGNKRYKVRLDL